MFEGSIYTKEELLQSFNKAQMNHQKRAQCIHDAFQGMVIQIFGSVISLLLFIMFAISLFQDNNNFKLISGSSFLIISLFTYCGYRLRVRSRQNYENLI